MRVQTACCHGTGDLVALATASNTMQWPTTRVFFVEECSYNHWKDHTSQDNINYHYNSNLDFFSLIYYMLAISIRFFRKIPESTGPFHRRYSDISQ